MYNEYVRLRPRSTIRPLSFECEVVSGPDVMYHAQHARSQLGDYTTRYDCNDCTTTKFARQQTHSVENKRRSIAKGYERVVARLRTRLHKLRTSSSGRPKWGARSSIKAPHLSFELFHPRLRLGAHGAATAMLVEEIREEVHLVLGQTVKQGEQSSFVAEHELCRNDGCRRRLAYVQRSLGSLVGKRLRRSVSE